MGLYIKNQHFVGAYGKTGSHANGFFSNRQLFHYKKDLYVTYYNPLNDQNVGKQKVKLDWDKIYNISDLSLSLPQGYSDDPTYFLPNQSADLGLESINVWTTRVYVQWNVIPITGRIKLILNNSNNQTIASYLIKKPLNTPFNIQDYKSDFPQNFTFNYIASGNNISEYKQQLQTVVVVLKYQPMKSTITVNATENGNTVFNQVNTGNVGDPFNISNSIQTLLSKYTLVSINNATNEYEKNPQTINIVVTSISNGSNTNGGNNNGGGNLPNNNPNNNQGTININYVDMNNKQIGSNSSTYITGFPFDVEPYELSVPQGYTFYQIIDNDDLDTYPSGSTTITIQCYSNSTPSPLIPTPNSHVPTPNNTPSTGSIPAYRVFVDETTDVSENPNTYDSSSSDDDERQPSPQSNVVYIDRNPIQVPAKDNIKFSDIGLYPNTTVLGPDEYWESCLNNESYVDSYEYAPDNTSNISAGTDNNGNTMITVNCKPAFVRDVTFELALPSGTSGINRDIVTAPFSGESSLPNGWSVILDPLTGKKSFRIPYGYEITENELISQLFGSSTSGEFSYNGSTYTLEDNREIHIDTPYFYLLYCSE